MQEWQKKVRRKNPIHNSVLWMGIGKAYHVNCVRQNKKQKSILEWLIKVGLKDDDFDRDNSGRVNDWRASQLKCVPKRVVSAEILKDNNIAGVGKQS